MFSFAKLTMAEGGFELRGFGDPVAEQQPEEETSFIEPATDVQEVPKWATTSDLPQQVTQSEVES